MSRKEDILSRIRENIRKSYDMPDISRIKGIQYPDVIKQFEEISKTVGGKVVKAVPGEDINSIIKELYPDAKIFASNLPEITIASKNPDILEAHELNGTDVGIIKGQIGVAENGCIWIPQTMKERAVCFISEYLVIIISGKNIVNNMHEAYSRIKMNGYGYGCFISGPSKTADIAQALVMGAQAARGVTVIITE
ncbi:LutC/YkgG family protein [Xylanibacter muris]|uniref:LUD domain-containing protein n=1 Tax=Xylanibacter muris TaxID=2736290 RepID=A0ABX2AK20_9BACT|nr:LUD domain-containing protein [Xylanibacter muris]NPD91531.1 LUD domain-containing protein [Xylanibacter muris]